MFRLLTGTKSKFTFLFSFLVYAKSNPIAQIVRLAIFASISASDLISILSESRKLMNIVASLSGKAKPIKLRENVSEGFC